MDDFKLNEPQDWAQYGPTPARSRKTAARRIVWGVVVVLLIAAGVRWTHDRPAEPARTGRFGATGPLPVVVSPAAKGDISITDDALGTVTPVTTVTVQTQISGQLTEVAFQEGQEVKKGDFLAQIDPRPYQAALDQAEGTLDRDQGSLDEAQRDYTRYEKLAAQNSIAQQQAQDQFYLVQQDKGTVKLDQAMVDNAKLNLAYCRIVSPLSGRIGLRQVDPGNYLQAGSAAASAAASTASGSSTTTTVAATAIAVITQMQPITVIFPVPEDVLPSVMTRLGAGATLAVAAYDRSGNTKLADGTLSAVDSEIDTTTGTVNLRATFANEGEVLFPDQFVNIKLYIDTVKNTNVIPTAAVERDDSGPYVFVVASDDKASLRRISLGPQAGERVEVTGGLALGDEVVTDGLDKLRDGAKVVLRPEAGATTADASPPTQKQPQHKRRAQESAPRN